MRISGKRFNKNLRNQFLNLICQVIVDTRNLHEARKFLEDLLSQGVLEIAVKKFAAAYYLNQGKTYKDIKNNLALSSATVASIAKQIRGGEGIQLALKKVAAEEWAQKWADRISGIMTKRPK